MTLREHAFIKIQPGLGKLPLFIVDKGGKLPRCPRICPIAKVKRGRKECSLSGKKYSTVMYIGLSRYEDIDCRKQ